MNIKGITPQIIPLDQRPKVDEARSVKTQHSTERDADGRRQQEEEESRRNLTDEDFNQAIEKLKEHPGIKANQLLVRVDHPEPGRRVVYIEDVKGHIVRRLSEADLWRVTHDRDQTRGQIIDKAM